VAVTFWTPQDVMQNPVLDFCSSSVECVGAIANELKSRLEKMDVISKNASILCKQYKAFKAFISVVEDKLIQLMLLTAQRTSYVMQPKQQLT
jgi:hypothetical protein